MTTPTSPLLLLLLLSSLAGGSLNSVADRPLSELENLRTVLTRVEISETESSADLAPAAGGSADLAPAAGGSADLAPAVRGSADYSELAEGRHRPMFEARLTENAEKIVNLLETLESLGMNIEKRQLVDSKLGRSTQPPSSRTVFPSACPYTEFCRAVGEARFCECCDCDGCFWC